MCIKRKFWATEVWMQPWRQSIRLGALDLCLRKQLPTIPTCPKCSTWVTPVLHQALGRQEFTKAEAVPTICPPIFPKLRQNQKNPDNSQFPDHLLNCQRGSCGKKGIFSEHSRTISLRDGNSLSAVEVQSFCNKLRCSDNYWACWNLELCTSRKASKTHSCIFVPEDY